MKRTFLYEVFTQALVGVIVVLVEGVLSMWCTLPLWIKEEDEVRFTRGNGGTGG